MRRLLCVFALLIALTGCTEGGCYKNPLNNGASNSTKTDFHGKLEVTALNGTATASNQAISLSFPDGSKATQVTGPNGDTTFQAGQEGYYIVAPASQIGRFSARLTTYLAGSKTFESVVIQLADINLIAASLDQKPQQFGYRQETFSYRITYHDGSIFQRPILLTADSAALPLGWCTIFSEPILAPGQATVLTVNTASGTLLPGVSIRINARSDSQLVQSTDIRLVSSWTAHVRRSYVSKTGCGGTVYTASFQIVGDNLPLPAGQVEGTVIIDSVSGIQGGCVGQNVGVPFQIRVTDAPSIDASQIAALGIQPSSISVSGRFVIGEQVTSFTDQNITSGSYD